MKIHEKFMKIHETSWIFMKMTDVKMTQMRLVKVHEVSWTFVQPYLYQSTWWIFMNKIIHEKCVILTSRIFMKVHEDSPLWLKVTECAWTSRLGSILTAIIILPQTLFIQLCVEQMYFDMAHHGWMDQMYQVLVQFLWSCNCK